VVLNRQPFADQDGPTFPRSRVAAPTVDRTINALVFDIDQAGVA